MVAVNVFGSVSNPVAIATGRPNVTRNQQVLCGVGFAKIDLARVVTKRVLYGEVEPKAEAAAAKKQKD